MSFVSDLLVRIRGDKTQLDSTLKGAESSMNSFGSIVKKIGGIIGIAFGVSAIVNFSKEAMKLAAEAEGVKNAFMKIGDAKSVLEDMKKATRGVIEESDLMQLAVKAQNFNIPLKDLSTYLEFATNRAITTGKSVSDLSDLIVTGLGRKSSRSFIQLGLSAKDVQEAFKTTGGMLNLVTEALDKMGPVADTAGIRMGTLAANMKNLKESWGEFLNNSKVVENVISGAALTFEKFASKRLTLWEKLMYSGKQYQLLESWYIGQENAKNPPVAAAPIVPVKIKEIETITTLTERLKEYKDELALTDVTDKATTNNLLLKINRTEAYIKKLGELAGAINYVETAQLNALPKNNKSTGSVFDIVTFGTAPALPNTLSKYSGTADPAKAALMAADVQDLSEGLTESQKSLLDLSKTFAGFFSDVNLGFQGMIDGVITGIKRLVMELLAQAIILTLLTIITGGTVNGAMFKSLLPAGLGKVVGSGGGGGAGIGHNVTQNQLMASINGRDLKIILRRDV